MRPTINIPGNKTRKLAQEPAEGAPPHDTQPRGTVGPRYTVVAELARGGLGRVCHATDEAFGRPVAIKQPLYHTADSLIRFEREAKVTARLQHAGVVPVYDYGHWPDGEPYFVMKKVDGRSLEEAIKATSHLDARLALLPRVLAVTDAMAYAHGQGVIHRDLKPANIILSDYGETVVIDWGLAKRLSSGTADPLERPSSAEGTAGMTRDGTVMGTPQFMSPEQAAGLPVNERSDVYALGAILYNVLSGAGPFSRETPTGALARVRTGPPPSLRQSNARVPKDLVAIVEKAMAREPEQRYASSRELAQDLRRFLDGQLVAAQSYSGFMLVARWVRRHRASAGLLLALVACAAIGVASVVEQRNTAVHARHESEARQNSLVLLHAERSLSEEPTASAAWLKSYRPSGPELWRANAIAGEAAASGVARHVFDHPFPAQAQAVSPAEPRMAVGWGDGQLVLYDLRSGGHSALEPHGAGVTALAFSGPGARLASGDRAGVLRLSTSAGQPLSRIDFGAPISRLLFSADGRSLAVGTDNRAVSLLPSDPAQPRVTFALRARLSGLGFCRATGRLLASDVEGHFSALDPGAAAPEPLPVRHSDARLLCLPDGRRLVTAGVDGVVQLWDLKTGALRTLGRHESWVTSIAASTDGTLVATGSGDDTVHLFSLTGAPTRVLRGHTDTVRGLAFSADQHHLVSTGVDAKVRIWDLRSGEPVREYQSLRAGSTGLSLSADGQHVVVSGPQETRVWPMEVPPVRVLRGHGGTINWLAWSPDGRALASASRDRTLRVWPYPDGAAFVSPPFEAWTMYVRFLGERHKLLVNTRIGRPRLFDLRTGQQHAVGEQNGLYSVPVTSQDRLAYPVARAVVVERLSSGTRLQLANSVAAVTDLHFMSGGARIAVASADGLLGVWNTSSGAAEISCQVGERILDIAVSPGDRRIAVFTANNRLLLWEPDTSRLAEVPTDRAAGTRLAFTSDGRRVFYAAADQTIRLIDVEGLKSRALRGHRGRVLDVVQAPGDPAALASSDSLGFVRLWNVDSGQTAVLQAGHLGIEKLAFSPDGQALAAGGEDAVIRVWQVNEVALGPPSAAGTKALAERTSALIDDQGRLRSP